jgi:two-component system, cell cycle sensor histidine kinase and response regulator CckA
VDAPCRSAPLAMASQINRKEKQDAIMLSQPYRILIVEDDSSSVQSLCGTLEGHQDSPFQFIHAASLETGLPVLAAEAADALLLNPFVLGNSGIPTVTRIHSQFDSLPIVVLLPQEKGALGQRFLDAGASEYAVLETLSRALLERVLLYAIERKRSEAALRQSEKRFQDLFDNAMDILFTLDTQGNITSLNKSAEDVMGWPRNEVLLKNIKAFVAPEHLDVCAQMMQRLLDGEQLQHFEVAMLRKDGRKVLLETSARVIRSKDEIESIQGIARDVTERRHLEGMVRQSQKLEAIGRLSGGLAHDFNNLLCVISGHTELLSERLEVKHPGVKNVAQIKKAVDSATSLVRQLLAFSRKQVFHPRTLDLNAIVVETEKLLGRLIGEHLEFFSSLHPALGRVRVDPVQIEQVLVNLVLNARDAMPQGGKLTIETNNVDLEEDYRSKRSSIPAGKYVVLAVTDNGSGMDEETQNRIFEPFYTTKELGKGTGLGLATVYGIVKQSGGSIWVYSEPGQGTTFKIYFPRVDLAVAAESSRKAQSDLLPGTETILLVENSEPLRALAREFLKSSGYAVLEAENGTEALGIANAFATPIHLLLTDVIMPGMGGKQLAGQLTSLRPGTKVLYMSGYSDDAIVQSGMLGTEMIFLEKPFTRDILLRKVRGVLDEVHQPV